ncbi:hypothetical protein [Alkalibacillus haloalkaliphilus]|uniref:hypothetical protein n=1 Tax=Alkalibacillus haloalkaliphilus TaxID=94136 RepID=UPI00030DD2A7|nr:hypothetical protein [Alkalibacillus haloalkaliphilus]
MSAQNGLEHMISQIQSLISNDSIDSREISMPKQLLQQPVSHEHKQATFMALVDAIVPSDLGALDSRIDDYLIWSIDHYAAFQDHWNLTNSSLSTQTASLLDIAAFQYATSENSISSPNFANNPNGGFFAALSAVDRFESIRSLENQQVDFELLPPPFRNNSGLVENMVTVIHQIVIFSYYSGWFSFGSTRLANPESRFVERKEGIWEKVGYPGPAYGYRALKTFNDKEGNQI